MISTYGPFGEQRGAPSKEFRKYIFLNFESTQFRSYSYVIYTTLSCVAQRLNLRSVTLKHLGRGAGVSRVRFISIPYHMLIYVIRVI